MKKFFTIGEAAKLVGMTAETLRHYDRIGLISPHKTDEWTKYRYYTEEEIVRLNTVRALRCMDLPLEDIRRVLQLNDVDEIVEFLEKTEQKAEEKIAELQSVKVRIGRAKKFYEGKRTDAPSDAPRIRDLPQRVILLSDALSEPTVENLWNYHRHFFAQVGEARKGQFAFEDLAGVCEAEGRRRMFAVCTRYAPDNDLRILPAGKYLCAECTEQTRAEVRRELLARAAENGYPAPQFLVEVVVLTGILQWKYEMQIFVDEHPASSGEISLR